MCATDAGAGGRPAHHDGSEGSLPRAIGTWPRAYALVVAALVVEVALFWLLGAWYGGGPA